MCLRQRKRQLSISPDDLARQLALVEHKLFVRIRARELTKQAWTKNARNTLSPNVVALTAWFNHVSRWISTEILLEKTPAGRAKVIEHFVRVGEVSQKMQVCLSRRVVVRRHSLRALRTSTS